MASCTTHQQEAVQHTQKHERQARKPWRYVRNDEIISSATRCDRHGGIKIWTKKVTTAANSKPTPTPSLQVTTAANSKPTNFKAQEAAENRAQSREAHATRVQRQAVFSAWKRQPGQGQTESTGVIKREPIDSNESEQESMIPRAAGFVTSPGEGGGMVEEEGSQGSHGGQKRRRGSVTGEGGSRSKKSKGAADAGPGAGICAKCTMGCPRKCNCKCHHS